MKKYFLTIVSLVVFSIELSAQVWHEDGLVSHYKFDQDFLLDFSSSKADLDFSTPNVTQQEDRFNNSNGAIGTAPAYLSGPSAHLPGGTEHRSFSIWIRVDSLPEPVSFAFFYGRLVPGRGQGLGILQDGTPFYSGFQSNVQSFFKIKMNTWTHLGMSFDSDTAKLYLDGELAGAAIAGGAWFTENLNPPLIFGVLESSPIFPFIIDPFFGAIDDFRAYDRELSENEMLLLAKDSLMSPITSIKESSEMGIRLRAYPNPANDVLNIMGIQEYAMVEIYDMKGSLIRKEETTDSINISELTNGSYILKIHEGTSSESQILIKN